jgi:ribosomal protein L37E
MSNSPSVPDAYSERPRFCSRCGQAVVVAEARFCKECGWPLPDQTARLINVRAESRFLPAALSIVPGLGHLYRGHPLRAMMWFFGIATAYAMAQPLGLLLHLVCAANAASVVVRQRDGFAGASRAGHSRA